jgi:hypothetical protein
VGGEDNVGALGDLGYFINEDDALGFELSDDVNVVNNLFADIDRSAIALQGLFHSNDGTVHSRAIPARGG